MALQAESTSSRFLPESPYIAVVANPKSAQGHKLEDRLDLLKREEYCADPDIVRTEPGGLAANIEALNSLLSPQGNRKRHDAVLVLGGDGTLNMLADFLLRTPDLPDNVRKMPVIIGPGGRFNDGHNMVFGSVSKRLSLRRLGELPLTTISPLSIKTSHDANGTSEQLAVLYASLGFSALVADSVNQNARRGPITIARALRESGIFRIIELNRQQRAIDLAISGGGPMTRLGLSSGGRQPRNELRRLTTRRRWDIIKMQLGIGSPDREPGYQQTEFTIHNGTGSGKRRGTPMQVDGEVDWLPHGTTIQIKPHDRALTVATTLLNQGRHHG